VTSTTSAAAEPLSSAALDDSMSVITVTYNSARDVGGLLASLSEGGAVNAEVIVVDNDSQDETLSVVEHHPNVRLVRAGANLGYSGAINRGRGIRRGSGAVVVLNPDLRLQHEALVRLAEALQDSRVGIAVPRILDADGNLFHSLRREPTVGRALGDALLGRRWPHRPAWLSEVVWDDRAYEAPHPVDWATGAALMVRPECDAALGDWDAERFFLYSEETDYARRARDAGYLVQYVPTATVVHRGSGSGGSALLGALLVVNRVRYFEKHHGRLHATAFRAAAALHELLRFWSPEHRIALRCVLRRSTWESLPGGDLVGQPVRG
jgi:N-acetylglucosaminyl-diphospho-decaprenol L-rhamnosyltransferase